MELNGALSNPRALLEVSGLGAWHARLVAKAGVSPRKPRAVAEGVPPVLRLVTQVLEAAGSPMSIREVHGAAERLAGRRLRQASVKGMLAAGTAGSSPRFRRLRVGVYEFVSDRLLAAVGGAVVS